MGIKPSLEEFTVYLTDERGVNFDSSVKAMFLFLKDYFKNKEFNKESVRILFNKLRTTTELKPQPLKPSAINKYLRVVKHIAHYMNLRDFDDFKGYRVRDDEVDHLGDLISDSEMKRISELRIKRKRDSEEIDLKWRCALSLMRFSGIQGVDLCDLLWSQDKISHFDFYRSKTGKHMRVIIIPEVRRMLDKLPRYNEYVFGSHKGRMAEHNLRNEIKKRCKILGINKRVTNTSFRYGFVTETYSNATEADLSKLAHIAGHSVDVALTRYAQMDIQPFVDALYRSHPGLRKRIDIDTLKRAAIEALYKIVDRSKYGIDLNIFKKNPNTRTITLT